MTAAQPGGGEGVRAMELSGELGTSLRSSEYSMDGGGLDKGDDDRDMVNERVVSCDCAERFTTLNWKLEERASDQGKRCEAEVVGAGRGKQPGAKSKQGD